MIQYHEIIDLTLPVITGMSVPPGNRALPPVELKNIKNVEESGIHVTFFQEGIHTGTHLDAPLHVVKGGTPIDELSLDYFMGEAYCIDCSMVKPNEPVTAAMLGPYESEIKKGMIVLLYTGWSDKMFGTDEYWNDSPYLGEDAAQWLADKGVKMAGYDFFQEIGAKSTVLHPEEFHVHHILLEAGCLNIEHMTNLGTVAGTHFELIALPLRLKGVEGSPTRAIALR